MESDPTIRSRRRRGPARRSVWIRPAAVGVLIAAGVLRCWLMPLGGHKGDQSLFWVWSAAVKEGGIADAYRRGDLPQRHPRSIEPCNYPPLYLYTLAGLGGLAEKVGLIAEYRVPARPDIPWRPDLRFLLKVPALLADLLTCYLLFRFWTDRGRPAAGLAAMAAYGFCLPVVYDAACWGQSDTVLAALLCLGAVAAMGQIGWLSGAAIAAAILLKPQGVLSLPIWLAIVVARAGGLGRSRRLWRFAAETAASAIVVGAAITWPAIRDGAGNHLLRVYTHSVGSHTSLTVLAFNAWYVACGPGVFDADVRRRTDDRTKVLGPIAYRHIGMAAFAAVCGAVIIAAARHRPPPEQVPVYAFVIAWSFFMLNTEMHERYGVPALVFLAMALPLGGRFIVIYGLLSLTNLWNLGMVFSYPGKIFGRWLPDLMSAPYSWKYGEVGFILATINCLALVWCFDYLFRGRPARRPRRPTDSAAAT